MTWKDTAGPALSRLPTIRGPSGHVGLREKAKWTALTLVLYFVLTNVQIWGLGVGSSDAFNQFRSILAGSQGSLLQLGIGPIVTGSIVLQLLDGAKLLGLNTTEDPRDQQIYQGLQKALVIVMVFVTAFPLVVMGNFLQVDPAIAGSLPGGVPTLQAIMFAQIAVGGILILYMDEVISKWGIGSGVGLFIIASVSQAALGGVFGWARLTGQNGLIVNWGNVLLGNTQIESVFTSTGLQQLLFDPVNLLALATTAVIFAVVVYAESVRVEVPLSNSSVKGARGKYPLKLIYASVLPMILVRALQANIQFIGRIMESQWADMPAWLGVYSNGQPTSGFFYYFAPIYSPEDWMWFLGTTSNEVWQIFLRISVDLTFMIIGGAVFAIFWVETADMGPESAAKSIKASGMQIPGFRRNPKIIERVLARYIPAITVIGGVLVGILAVGANMLGTIGNVSGTGLLLAVSITYKIYEEIAKEQLMEMHPMMRQFFN